MRIAAITLLLACLATPALAQYFPDSTPGYSIKAADSRSALGVSPRSPLWNAAAECSSIQLQAMFKVVPGMSSYFEVVREGEVRVAEYVFSAAKPGKAVAPVTDYLIEGKPLYIAFGDSSSDGYTDCVVASYLWDGEAIEELDRFTLGAEYCAGVYALDLTGDGVTDLAVPYTTGAGGGGGIEVRSIVPTGGLAWFGNDELDSTLFSQSGYINLRDYDGDGDWEIETLAPVLCSACGYMWGDLYTFDSAANNWELDLPRFAGYYKPQQDFYRALNTAVQKLAAGPASMAYSGKAIEAKYATQIGGQWYALDVFMDAGKVDKTWVSQLASLVGGW